MKMIVKRSMALLLTLVMILTMGPMATLAETADDGRDEDMSLPETYADETIESEQPEMTEENENLEDSESLPEDSEPPAAEEWPDEPGAEDDWADWYPDDSEEWEDDPFWGEEEQPDEWEEDDLWKDDPIEDEVPRESELSLKDHLDLYGYAYVQTKGETQLYNTLDCTGEPIFTLTEKGTILLVTEYQADNADCVKVWFLGDDSMVFTGYTSSSSLQDTVLSDDVVDFYTDFICWGYTETDSGILRVFLAAGYPAPVFVEVPQDEECQEQTQEEPGIDEYVPQEWPENEEETADLAEQENISSAVMAISPPDTESIRLGKEGNVISGIFVLNDGSNSTSITRHWVTVDGMKYTAFCIEASKSSTSGAAGSLQVGTDAGLQWILINVPDSTDEEYAIKQQAIWSYQGQSYSPRSLKAGSKCSLSTEELRSRLESIVASANCATFNSRYQLWIAYHNTNRNYYQDMAFITSAPEPTPIPPPVPTPEPMLGRIRITKTDALTHQNLAGVVFDIYQGSVQVDSMTTDAFGAAISNELPVGSYTVKERALPDGYTGELVSLDCAVYANTMTDLSAENGPIQFKIKIVKTDALTKAPLAGAEFTITRKDSGEVAAKLTTNEQGEAISDLLRWGEYEIRETKTPEHYKESTFSTTIKGTENEKVYEIKVENEPSKGWIWVTKMDALDGHPISGVVFDIYQGDQKITSMTTDADGIALSEPLSKGHYSIREREHPQGYTGELFSANCDVQSDEITELTAQNTPIQCKVKILKTDQLTHEPLAGAEFTVTRVSGLPSHQGSNDGEVVAVMTTNAEGIAVTPLLTWGTYNITETKVPEHYVDNVFSTDVPVFVGDENALPGETHLIEVNVANDPVMGQIVLEKKSLQLTGFEERTDGVYTWSQPIYEEGYLAGAVFEIHAAEDVTGRDGTVWFCQDALVDTLVTTADGPVKSKPLPPGRYYLIETEAPEGYALSDTRYEADLVYVDDKTPLVETLVTAENIFLPAEISLQKEKEIIIPVEDAGSIRSVLTTAPGEGFTFGIYNETDIHYNGGTLMADTLMDVGVTDQDGSLVFSGYYPHGRYAIRELATPEGWRMDTQAFHIVLDPAQAQEDAVIRVALPEPILNNLIQYPVTLTKLDISGQHTLPGTEIEVCNAEGKVIYRAATDARGEIPNIPVTPGTYTFREVYAPNGYALNEAVMAFTVDDNGSITGDTAIRDDFTRFTLLKQDADGRALAGVEFALIRENGSTAMTAVSNSDGRVVFEQIPFGSYRLAETKALAGYLQEEIGIEVTVDGTFINREEPLVVVVNEAMCAILQKENPAGEPLRGAVFGLFDSFGEQLATAVSDENGLARFEKIPYGDFTIRELEAPAGYLLNKNPLYLSIGRDWMNCEKPFATVVNQRKRVSGVKVGTDGKPIANVTFQLVNASTGEIAETSVTNDRGEFSFTLFDYGFWKIVEAETPEGYAPMNNIVFSVDASWTEPEPFLCVNIPNHYEFMKVDNQGSPMAGVKFALEDQEGNILRELVSDHDGIVHVDDLIPGIYLIREIETWDGYTVSGETIELVIDEHYVIPDVLDMLVNYPEIQTGVDFEIPPMMYAGGAAVLSGIVLLTVGIAWKKKSRKK